MIICVVRTQVCCTVECSLVEDSIFGNVISGRFCLLRTRRGVVRQSVIVGVARDTIVGEILLTGSCNPVMMGKQRLVRTGVGEF